MRERRFVRVLLASEAFTSRVGLQVGRLDSLEVLVHVGELVLELGAEVLVLLFFTLRPLSSDVGASSLSCKSPHLVMEGNKIKDEADSKVRKQLRDQGSRLTEEGSGV